MAIYHFTLPYISLFDSLYSLCQLWISGRSYAVDVIYRFLVLTYPVFLRESNISYKSTIFKICVIINITILPYLILRWKILCEPVFTLNNPLQLILRYRNRKFSTTFRGTHLYSIILIIVTIHNSFDLREQCLFCSRILPLYFFNLE